MKQSDETDQNPASEARGEAYKRKIWRDGIGTCLDSMRRPPDELASGTISHHVGKPIEPTAGAGRIFEHPTAPTSNT